jgi:hypothetical protein
MSNQLSNGLCYEILRKPYALQLLSLTTSTNEMCIMTQHKTSSYITNQHKSNIEKSISYKTFYTFISGVAAGVLSTLIQHNITNFFNKFKSFRYNNN